MKKTYVVTIFREGGGFVANIPYESLSKAYVRASSIRNRMQIRKNVHYVFWRDVPMGDLVWTRGIQCAKSYVLDNVDDDAIVI